VYDGLGRRDSKTINGNLTEFLYDGDNPVQESSGVPVTANILSGLRVDEVFSRTDVPASVTSHFLRDALGSTIAMSDSAGTVQTEYTYEPFGKTSSSGTSNTNSYQYTGRENDGTGLYYYRSRYYHVGLHRFISQDKLLQPYLELLSAGSCADPILAAAGENHQSVVMSLGRKQPQLLNAYSYVANDPLGSSDPMGLSVSCVACGWLSGRCPVICRRSPVACISCILIRAAFCYACEDEPQEPPPDPPKPPSPPGPPEPPPSPPGGSGEPPGGGGTPGGGGENPSGRK
jgi:RHS repeat-associated protein